MWLNEPDNLYNSQTYWHINRGNLVSVFAWTSTLYLICASLAIIVVPGGSNILSPPASLPQVQHRTMYVLIR